MPLNPNIALIPSQGVQAQGSAIDNMFNTYYKSAGNARQNALLDLQTQSQAFNQGIQVDANNRTNEAHSLNQEAGQFKLDQAQGHQVYRALKSLEGLDPQSRAQQIDILMPGLAQFGFDADDREMLSTEEGYQQAMQIAERFAPISSDAGTREFNSLSKNLSDEDVEKAKRIKLGLDPRAGSSSAERIATDSELGQSVADQEGAEAGAKEEAKLEAQLELKPQVQAAVKEAEAAAASKGESLSEYRRAKAALPGIHETVAKLKTLSEVATYTMTGRAFNEMAKQMGFGSTEGATARSTMESIVDNQVLPLLRDTFGAAFTAAEGDRLRNSLLDPNGSPDQKKATLDAFLDQKMRNLEAKETELGIQQPKAQSIDDLVNKYAN